MLLPLLVIALAVLVFAPSLWVRFIFARYGKDKQSIPGTGGELARHLVKRFELAGVSVEETGDGKDHFDPAGPAVRLGPRNFHGKSLTAVAVAAHEIGHAIQFHRKEEIFRLRSRYLPLALTLGQAGVSLLWAIPILGLIVRSPVLIGTMIGFSVVLQVAGALAYLVILPEEWDASFNKALPILVEGEYIAEKEVPAVRRILKAAALTYFASALANVLNIWRWFMVLRR